MNKNFLSKGRFALLYALNLMCFTYAGLAIFFIFCPFEAHFSTIDFLKYWQVVDGYMGKRMPIFGNIWLVLFVLNLIFFFKTRKISPIFWLIVGAFVLVVADIIFTVQSQIPINQYIQSLDLNHLTTEQSNQLQNLREQSNKNFGFRHILQWGQFVLMSFTPYLLPKLEERLVRHTPQ
ncbi:MAG: hypothetical protein JNL70_13500 [Saprospiraceae bacterium]|nr:hypothetical protein [Saprospiraceae bacterium]